ncbi:MAG: hypothetical protein JWQ90_2676 [Hydrocarboniphaga sp.]|uniref:DUF1214 domain-containing protein n=1 Tax=Hydrocarboniphaga sp. TaxID=2033016 RepID=UPI00261A023A|nr:DUF1214 domain-containing protein [Hydrocarboniphaga sp.]MDB5970226.1 hypothetical protein [Hydrocarboniphaga sp.]
MPLNAETQAAAALLSAAWQDFAAKLGRSAATIATADFADSPRDLAEGHRYLARLIAYAIQEAFCFSDPEFPAFHRSLDHLAPWGAPNLDNVYSMAVIDGRKAYRVWGKAGSIDGFILNLNEGVFPIFPGFKTSLETSSRELHIDEDGRFELMLSAERPADWTGNWMRLNPGDRKFSIRQYLTDWDRHRPVDFHIVCLGNEGLAPQPLTPQQAAGFLDEAVTWAHTLAAYYLQRLKQERLTRPYNQLPPPEKKVPGSEYVHYGIAFFDVADDEALLIEMPHEPAPYWSFQLYNFWNEFTDPFNRITSINHRQAQIDDDGMFRMVIAQRDPGTANWLDAAGQRRGYLWYRWIWAERVPTPVARLVKLSELLPSASPRVDDARRRQQIMQRRSQLEARYHG